MKKLFIALAILAGASTVYGLQEFQPTIFTSVTATNSVAGYQSASYSTTSPTIVKIRPNAAGTYIVGSGTPTPIASGENVQFVLNGTCTFSLASSAGASKVFIQAGRNTVQD